MLALARDEMKEPGHGCRLLSAGALAAVAVRWSVAAAAFSSISLSLSLSVSLPTHVKQQRASNSAPAQPDYTNNKFLLGRNSLTVVLLNAEQLPVV